MWIHVNTIKYILFAIMHFVYAPCQVYFENRMLTPSLASHSGRFGCVYRKCQYNGCSRISVSADLTTDTRVSAGLTAVFRDLCSSYLRCHMYLAFRHLVIYKWSTGYIMTCAKEGGKLWFSPSCSPHIQSHSFLSRLSLFHSHTHDPAPHVTHMHAAFTGQAHSRKPEHHNIVPHGS